MNTAQRETSLSRTAVATALVLGLCAVGAAPVQSCGFPWPGGSGGSPGAALYCGDGKVNQLTGAPPFEQCDRQDLAGQTCATMNQVGTLRCRANCTLDTSDCKPATCGNGRTDSGEACDGNDLGGATCSENSARKPECFANCLAVNYQPCTAAPGTRCGNGIVETGEICDGPMSCVEYTKQVLVPKGFPADYFTDGMIECPIDCSEAGVITNGCRSRRCGNGVLEREYGENCDGRDFGGSTCATSVQIYLGGEYRCGPNCQFDGTDCHGCMTGRGLMCR
jgi:hypothetical protein